MLFTAAAATFFFGASALAAPGYTTGNTGYPAGQAAPASGEDVTIKSFSAHKVGADGASAGNIDGISFKLTGRDATDLTCLASFDKVQGLPTDVINCADGKYRFRVAAGADSNSFAVTIYHEVGTAAGFSGESVVPVNCRSGGQDTEVCSQVADATFHLA
ncbi:uncharacterized protein GGS25DRAFT_488484 [Hypoxylon fragiforme]|uniref:uncharacterized protein n=1 Tax=Hypoxylon fragiforme TaxID=63214 RepID=UPI0020C72676|nr:uncharacterized protein GGS25DRAFT_488484 [Hypoxylon fragiforme]KAI2610365.1 hypothetical protein GGS25DRAFT_488484 [Hypoxylon fragiforme]